LAVFVVYREWPRVTYNISRARRSYMLSVAIVEVIPESVHLAGEGALIYVLVGFFIVHPSSTPWRRTSTRRRTHTAEMQHGHAQTAIFLGLRFTFFDGSPSASVSGFHLAGHRIFVAVFFTNFPRIHVASVVMARIKASACGSGPRGSSRCPPLQVYS